ncbi:MAG: hypothetical protein H6868_05750 [Rhodospirillales bacterium]|nr:hypothetical protein [Rhodospirillales bacterium]
MDEDQRKRQQKFRALLTLYRFPALPRLKEQTSRHTKLDQITDRCGADPMAVALHKLSTLVIEENQFKSPASQGRFLNSYDKVCDIISGADAYTNRLVLFSGQECKKEAEHLAIRYPQYDTIDTTPAGFFLNLVSGFIHNKELLYLAGYIVAMRVIATISDDEVFCLLNGSSETSTYRVAEAWSLAASPAINTVRQYHLSNYSATSDDSVYYPVRYANKDDILKADNHAPTAHLMNWMDAIRKERRHSYFNPTNNPLAAKFHLHAQDRVSPLNARTIHEGRKIAYKHMKPLLEDLKNANSIPDHLRNIIPV